MASLQRFLDRDFLSFWDVRRCGRGVGLEIKCPVCPALPPRQEKGEDYIWYGYRKWRWLANHMVSAHMAKSAVTHRRIVAEQKRIEVKIERKTHAA